MNPRPLFPFAGLLAAAALAAHPWVPGEVPAGPVALTNATVHPVSGPSWERATVVMQGGRITAVGPDVAVPAGAAVLDLAGQHVYPGLIAAHTNLGLVEIGLVRATVDAAERDPDNANARAATALNPDSELLPVTRANGVLLALSVPGRGVSDYVPNAVGSVGGLSALIRLDGWTRGELVARSPVALHLTWPGMGLDPEDDRPPARQREALAERLRFFDTRMEEARAYAAQRTATGPAPHRQPAGDRRLEAWALAAAGDVPVFVEAHAAVQIRAACAWARRHRLRLVVVGGAEADLAAADLLAAGAAVIVAPVNELPLRRGGRPFERLELPGRLAAAGVPFCISTSPEMFTNPGGDRNLPYEAAAAAAHGLDEAAALRAITLSAAEILGVAERVGSLEPGKEATLIVTDGPLFSLATEVRQAFSAGALVDLRSRHTALRDKYAERYR